MNLLDPWNAVFFAGFVAYMALRHAFEQHARGEKAETRRDRTENVLLVVVGLTCLGLPVLYLLTPLFSFADYAPPAFVPATGTAVLLGALGLFYRAHKDLGKNWSVSLEIRPDHQLVTKGVYRSIRHPMYAAIFLFCLAQGLLLQNWLAGWAGLPGFAALYLVRTPREERMMLETFGEPYRDYMRRTGRVFPRLFAQKASERAT